MTDPRRPDDPAVDAGGSPPAPSTPPPPSTADPSDSPTQAWPSLATPDASPDAPASDATGSGAATAAPSSGTYEPASSLPATRLGAVEAERSDVATTSRGRPGVRWLIAGAGIAIVAIASFVIVSLVGGRPATSTAMGYVPPNTVSYTEVRLDLPGDQRTKLATFLKAFPGFEDQSAIDPKLDDVFDRIVRAASDGKQTWTNDIKPWFGGQIAIAQGLPDPAALSGNSAAMAASGPVGIVTITDRAKAAAWVASVSDKSSMNQSTYGDADLFVGAEQGGGYAVAVTDKVMIAGATTGVKAAVDGGGRGTFDQNDDVKAALATIDKDYVLFGVSRTRALAEAYVQLIGQSQPGVLDRTTIDETVLDILPAWQASSARFENDAIVMSSTSPPFAIGFDGSNRASTVLNHLPAKTYFAAEAHDAGPAISAFLTKFRALPETKPFFDQFDQAISVLGGFDATIGWWGDTAVVVSQTDGGVIGGGLVIQNRDAAASSRLFTTLEGFLALAGGGSGVTVKSEDHNGTKVTILDLSAVPGMSTTGLPPGYKPEFAWATNKDITVLGYGANFVKAVLDSGPGNSLADDARFKALLNRVGGQNMATFFLDVNGIRTAVEPIAQSLVDPSAWTRYTTEIQRYLTPLDAFVGSLRKDGNVDRGTVTLTVH